jgi:hypothetical protein
LKYNEGGEVKLACSREEITKWRKQYQVMFGLQVWIGKRRNFQKKQWKNQDVPRKEVWKDVGSWG